MDRFQLRVVTPSGSIYDESVASVTANTCRGEITVLPEHSLLLSQVEAGRMVIRPARDAEAAVFVLDSGFLEAGPDHVNIISENCLSLADIDVEAVTAELASVQERLGGDVDGPTREQMAARERWLSACLYVAAHG